MTLAFGSTQFFILKRNHARRLNWQNRERRVILSINRLNVALRTRLPYAVIEDSPSHSRLSLVRHLAHEREPLQLKFSCVAST